MGNFSLGASINTQSLCRFTGKAIELYVLEDYSFEVGKLKMNLDKANRPFQVLLPPYDISLCNNMAPKIFFSSN